MQTLALVVALAQVDALLKLLLKNKIAKARLASLLKTNC
jgi:hypothetical protein